MQRVLCQSIEIKVLERKANKEKKSGLGFRV